LPRTNTLAYWAYSFVMKKMKCCVSKLGNITRDTHSSLLEPSISYKENEVYLSLENIARDTHSNLLGPIISYAENKVI